MSQQLDPVRAAALAGMSRPGSVGFQRKVPQNIIDVSWDGDNGELCVYTQNREMVLFGVLAMRAFDYIRYPGRDGCFCPGCRERFEAVLGRKVADWPRDLRRDKALERAWLDFRREQITRVVREVHRRVKAARPACRISAAVFRNWPVDRDSVGQDWKLWCDRGWLDFVCPMDYTPHDAQFEGWVRQQLAWAGKVPCYPGIGLSVWSDPTDVAKVIEQVTLARRLGAKGFTIFEYRAPVPDTVLPLCGQGLTRPR